MRQLDPELEEEVMEIARRLGREREMWQGMVLVSLAMGRALLLLKWLFHW
jgi:hypothetical protein